MIKSAQEILQRADEHVMDHLMDESLSRQPSFLRDRSFYGMLFTQFLGAFNDNYFKQIVLFVCIDLARENRAANPQGLATILFAAPFILFSGYFGYLSDLRSKRDFVVLCKVLEIGIMFLGLGAFYSGKIWLMLAIVFLMGVHSALFGPSKYGILPELFRDEQLPRINGLVNMTTFLAIILAFPFAGQIKEWSGEQLWKASLVSICIAVAGTLTSLLVCRTPIARPGLPFHWSALIVRQDTARVILQDRRLLYTLMATSLFWMTGGLVYPPAINDLGGLQLNLSDRSTGLLAACTGVGIVFGCVAAGWLSRERFQAGLVRAGVVGMFLGLILLGLPGTRTGNTLLGIKGSAAALVWLGLCAGAFTVPLTAFLQAKTPSEHKGRVIGTMNLVNFLGMALAGVYYSVLNPIFAQHDPKIPPNAMFLAAAAILLPLVLFYRPKSEPMAETA